MCCMTLWAGPLPDPEVFDQRVLVSADRADLTARVITGNLHNLISIPGCFISEHREEPAPGNGTDCLC